MKCPRFSQIILSLAFVASLSAAAERNSVTILHQFDRESGCGTPIISGTVLYGMVSDHWGGGGAGVFKINCDGSGFTKLHTFPEGANPVGSLTLAGSCLYGVAGGEIFKMNTDGSGFKSFPIFAGVKKDGRYPWGSLVISGSSLYGVACLCPSRYQGALFRINTDGGGFTNLHTFGFLSGFDQENTPCRELTLLGNSLYGMTESGGEAPKPDENGVTGCDGIIYKINCDGSGYTFIHGFRMNRYGEGTHPTGSLTVAGSTLYGLTEGGGERNGGTLFKINPDGSGFAILHSFVNDTGDNMGPRGPLILSGTTLYGVTRFGRRIVTEHSRGMDGGVLFKINCDGSGYTNLHSFASDFAARDNGNVETPEGGMVMSGTSFYGVTEGNLKFGLRAVIFKLDIAP